MEGRAPARSAAARPMIVSGAAPPRVDTLRRVRRCMSRPVFRRFCHARSRVPMVLGPFHYCAFCERAWPGTVWRLAGVYVRPVLQKHSCHQGQSRLEGSA